MEKKVGEVKTNKVCKVTIFYRGAADGKEVRDTGVEDVMKE
jgi:hypothetical protein